MPVHLYGQMCDMRRIHAIAQKHNLQVIEDAAHCVEGSRDGVRPGELADTCCFSFYATKNLTCGEGGAVTCNSDELQNKLRLLRTHGMDKTAADRAKEGYQHWDMVMLGWKYNMDNIQAAILLPQMDRLEDNFKKRQNLAEYFERKIATINGLRTPAMRPDVVHARHLFPILIDGGRRDHFINGLKARNIGVMVNYRAIHLLSYFRNSYGYKSGDFPNAEKFGDSILSLPFYPNMPEEHVDIIAEALKEIAATH
jgi:UDP-4-amino-4-deoxy-L-arabinose-oxoglutarate aminotransferase